MGQAGSGGVSCANPQLAIHARGVEVLVEPGDRCFVIIHTRARSSVGLEYLATNQGVVGSSPAGRANIQGLGSENRLLLPAVGPLWDLLSTGPRGLD